jgi:signal transduction histidine kinase
MLRPSGRMSWIIFCCSVLFLAAVAVAADWTTARYASSEYWVSHTQLVETRLLELRADLLSAEAGRLAYISSDDARELPTYEAAMREVPVDLDALHHLTFDNPSQRERLNTLRPLVEQRLGLLRESVELAKAGLNDHTQQEKLTESGTTLNEQIRAILNSADAYEQSLHKQRQTISDQTYAWARTVLATAFIAAFAILAAAFWRLAIELRERKQTEEVVRRLTGRLLKVQDDERRRIARELHDSLGQLLSSLKLNLDHLMSNPPKAEVQAEILETCVDVAQQSIDETRTLSYLLHPPLLDEFGFSSAAKWYVDGFAKRSKIQVKLEIDGDFGRMPDEIEIALFRVLQESLTNIHRHSGSSTAEIKVGRTPSVVKLRVADQGKGISPEVLERFRRTRGGLGVGLAGMRERVEELGGSLKLESEGKSTILSVSIPLPKESADRKVSVNRPGEAVPPQASSSSSAQTQASASSSSQSRAARAS